MFDEVRNFAGPSGIIGKMSVPAYSLDHNSTTNQSTVTVSTQTEAEEAENLFRQIK